MRWNSSWGCKFNTQLNPVARHPCGRSNLCTRVKRDKSGGLVPSVTAENQKNAKALLSDLEHKLPSPESWIYGENPTAIDAHLVVFIARMIDVGREQLIPEKLRDYTHWAMQKPEWVDMMGGRTTMIEQ